MGFSRQEYWSGLPFPSPVNLPDPGIEPKSPALQANSLPSEPPGKPKNAEVGSQSLLQGIFLTQELNQNLLHCRWIIYQLSYEGSPAFWSSQWINVPVLSSGAMTLGHMGIQAWEMACQFTDDLQPTQI